MKRIDRKGFTLVELLVTIVIVGLVAGLTTFGVISVIDSSKKEANIISENSVKEAARLYSSEEGSYWKNAGDDEAFCVTVAELMNKGLLDKNADLIEDLKRNDYVMVKRHKINYTIFDASVLSSSSLEDNICTGQEIKENDKVKKQPKINGYDVFTDEIDVTFEGGEICHEVDGSETECTSEAEYRCFYSESSSNVDSSIDALKDGDKYKCEIKGLNKATNYTIIVHMTVDSGTTASSEPGDASTSDLKAPKYQQDKNKITITYDKTDNNGVLVKDPKYYFKSNVKGESKDNVSACTLKNNKFTCNDTKQKTVEKDTWYKSDTQTVVITYPEENNNITVTGRITDRSDNYSESSKDFKVNRYTITFNLNNAKAIDGETKDIQKYCISGGTDTCSVVSPTIEAKDGYSVVGWNTSSSAASSSWEPGKSKSVSKDAKYYAITIKKSGNVNIKYNVNGGSLATTSNSSGSWSVKDGIVYLNNEVLQSKIASGAETGEDGIYNYDNKNYLNISRTGYSAVSKNEWICLEGCTTPNKTFDQTTVYKASDFCDASNGDCTVVLGVNWKVNTVQIKYSTNGGTIATSNTGGTWSQSNGLISHNGSLYQLTINYGGDTGVDGLANYNNSAWVNITRTGYSAVSKNEWICLEGCTTSNKTFDQNTLYKASDFCDASSRDCSVVLGVNWEVNTYTIKFDANGGNLGSVPNQVIKTYGVTLKLPSASPARSGYSFQGWSTSKDATVAEYLTGSSYTKNENATLYAIWQPEKNICDVDSSKLFGSYKGDPSIIIYGDNFGAWLEVEEYTCYAGNPTCQRTNGYDRKCPIDNPECIKYGVAGMTAREINKKFNCNFGKLWCNCKTTGKF